MKQSGFPELRISSIVFTYLGLVLIRVTICPNCSLGVGGPSFNATGPPSSALPCRCAVAFHCEAGSATILMGRRVWESMRLGRTEEFGETETGTNLKRMTRSAEGV